MASKSHNRLVSDKIERLVAEGTSHKQAVAEALAMGRAGRLTAGGGYRRVQKKGKG